MRNHGDHDAMAYDGPNANLAHLCQICGALMPKGEAMNLSDMQAAAVRYAAANPGASADQIVDAVGVKGGADNRAMFIFRLINKGALRLDVTFDAADAVGIEV